MRTINLRVLNGANGFRLTGATAGDYSGYSVSAAGDVNGDGFDDLIVGAPFADPNGYGSGVSYVVFGKSSGFASSINLSTLNGANGFRLTGAEYDYSGFSVSGAGDVNGDGFDDLIVGAPFADPNGYGSGASYVVFGKSSGFASSINLSTLNGANGFRLTGATAGDYSGRSVSAAGDVNGDGFDDLIVGAPYAGSYSGASYVVFGKASGFAANLNLATLNGANGFRLTGAEYDYSGFSVSAAGDVNGDGFDDLIVGAPFADPNGISSGASYVVFGKASGFAASLNLATLNGANGFRLTGAEYDSSGFSVSGAGDVNGDGFDDLIVGAPFADPNGYGFGVSYVVFGKISGFASSINLSTLNGANGFRLTGYDSSGHSVSAAGDVNGDGFDDLIVGAPYAELNGSNSGASYVVFGKASGFSANLNLATLDAANGFRLAGAAAGDYSGRSVSAAGDVNGDGFDDLIIGASGADPNGSASGASYVVFGGVAGAVFPGTDGDDTFIGGLGDDTINGGAGDDILAGGTGLDTADYTAAIGAIIVNLATGTASGADGNDTLISIEALIGSVFDDFLTGDGNDNVLDGRDGSDTLSGGDGDDALDGNAGADLLDGGGGSDVYYVDNANDVVIETPNVLLLAAADSADRLSPALPIALNALEDVIDTVIAAISYSLANVAYVENLSLVGTATTGTGNELDNVLAGNALNNTLTGLAGNDTLTGGGGNDTLDGGAGIDSAIYSGNRSAYAIGAAGVSVSGPDGSDTLSNIERLQFSNASLAFDLDRGEAAGNTVRLIGAAFGKQYLTPEIIGIVVDVFDAGYSLPLVSAAALTVLGSPGNAEFVGMIFRNVVEIDPPADAQAALVGLLDSGAMTQTQMLEIVANLELNETHIGLVGMQQNGVEFV